MGLRYVIFLCPENWSETRRRILSPFLFSVFIDDLVKLVNKAVASEAICKWGHNAGAKRQPKIF